MAVATSSVNWANKYKAQTGASNLSGYSSWYNSTQQRAREIKAAAAAGNIGVSGATPYDLISGGSSSVSSSAFNSALDMLTGVTQQNNALMAQAAKENRDWQRESNQIAMQFSSAEAEKNRKWQEYMSNTAHQREIADLKAAGLNPILSAMGGNGAAVGSGATAQGFSSGGATADVDTSGSSAMVSLMAAMLSAQTQLAMQQNTALNNLAVADKYTAMQEIVAGIGAQATLGSAGIHADASKYGSWLSSETQKYLAQHYPNNSWSAFASLINTLLGDDPKGNIQTGASTGKQVVDKILGKDYYNQEYLYPQKQWPNSTKGKY